MLNAGVRIGFLDSVLSTIRVHKNQTSSQNRALMAKGQREIAKRNGFGGCRYAFYMTILHGLNFMEQLRFGYQNKKFAGVKDVFHDWIFGKLKSRLINKQ
jgi:hypothetical protein